MPNKSRIACWRARLRNALMLQEQGLDTMSVDHLFAGGPAENGESPVLRGYEGDRIPLIVRELCGRKVAGAAELSGLGDYGGCAFDRLRHDHPGDLFPGDAPDYLRAESQQLIFIRNDGR